jgi:hypothetical protein
MKFAASLLAVALFAVALVPSAEAHHPPRVRTFVQVQGFGGHHGVHGFAVAPAVVTTTSVSRSGVFGLRKTTTTTTTVGR